MNKTTLYILRLFPFCLYAQTVIDDTIYVSKDYVTNLTFGKKVQQLDLGSDVFLLSKDIRPNSVEGNSVMKIKARKKFKKTNITTITDGLIYYNIICIYSSEKPDELFHFYHMKKKIIGSDGDVTDQEGIDVYVEEAQKQEDRESLFQQHYFTDTIYYKEQAKRINANKRMNTIHRWYVKNSKVGLSLVGAYSRKDKIYLKSIITHHYHSILMDDDFIPIKIQVGIQKSIMIVM